MHNQNQLIETPAGRISEDYLKQYLLHILKIESNLYTLDNLMSSIQYKISMLGHKREIPLSIIQDTRPSFIRFLDCFGYLSIGAISGSVAGLIITFIYQYATHTQWTLNKFFDVLFSDWATKGKGALIGAAICAIFALYLKLSENNSIRRKNEMSQAAYTAAVTQDNNRIVSEQYEIQNMTLYYNDIYSQYDKTKKVLERLYSADIIHKDYRNMVCIAAIYQYFDTGRCSALKGHEGAYNLLENELRLNKIATKLDSIIAQLEDIKYNQGTLYNIINESNSKIDTLTQQSQLQLEYAQATERNSQIIAYNTAVTAQNTEAIKWLQFINLI